MPVDAEDATKTKNKNVLRKAVDTDFCYVCEWCDCQHNSNSMNEFNHHVSLHRRAYTQHLGPEAERGEEEFIFYCQWRDCHSQIEGKVEEFTRHVHYHTFHQYLKFLGRHIQKVDKMGQCGLGTLTRNMIPELPEKLMCRWQDCNMVYDNPYIFYSHVAHHCEDIPKEKKSNQLFACKWEGCKAVLKSWYKIREHMRSHTQAKVVACPTCGSLFANNTRFIDHLMRQLQTGPTFVCSNCGAKFSSERLLRDHMRRHVNHYKCPLCDMTCPSPSGVRDHVRYRHSDERTYQCPDCDYKAKTSADLRAHLLSDVHNSRPGSTNSKKRGSSEGSSGEELSEAEEEEEAEEQQEEEAEDSQNAIVKRVTKILQSVEKEVEAQKSGPKNYKIRHRILGARANEPLFQCHLCEKDYKRGSYLSIHLREVHKYTLPSGHKRFRYKLHDDNFWRLQTVRLESQEVSEQLLGQDLSSPQGSDEEEEGNGDSNRLMIDETARKGGNARASGSKRGGKKASKTNGSSSQVEQRRSPQKGSVSSETTCRELLQSQEGVCNDAAIGNKAGKGSLEENAVEASRRKVGDGCKRKRSESEEKGDENCSKRQKPQKRGNNVAQESSCEDIVPGRLSPSKTSSIKTRSTKKSLISLAAAAAGIDTSECDMERGSEAQRLSMPSMEDLSTVPTISHSSNESQTGKGSLSSNYGFYTEGKSSKSRSSSPCKKVPSGRPVRKSRALPSRFNTKRSCLSQEPPSPSPTPISAANPVRRTSPRVPRARESESDRVDMSPAAASTVSSSSAWMPPSVDGVESNVDDGDAASASATPHYGTDTDFSEFNPDSPGSSTSVYAINPQYIQELKQRLQQQPQPQENQQLLQKSQVSEIPKSQSVLAQELESYLISTICDQFSEDQDALSDHMTSEVGTVAEAAASESNVNLPQQAAVVTPSQHREDTSDGWSALLTQAELCLKEQQGLGSPSKYAEVIVGSRSQLSVFGGVSSSNAGQSGLDPLQSLLLQQADPDFEYQQMEHTQPHSSTIITTTSTTTTTSVLSPQRTMATPLLSSQKSSFTTLVSPQRTMFPSPEKSFFTIGWALGAGVSPVKHEWKPQQLSESCSRSSVNVGVSQEGGSGVKEVILTCEEDASLGFGKESSHIGKGRPSTYCNSNNNSIGIQSTGTVEGKQFETLHGAAGVVNFASTSNNPNDEFTKTALAAKADSVTVLSDSNMISSSYETNPIAPQEIYQVVEGPNGEYQIVGLTSADLYNFVDSEGRSVVFSLDGAEAGTDCSDLPSTTVAPSAGWVLPAAANSEGDHVPSNVIKTDLLNVDLELETAKIPSSSMSGSDLGLISLLSSSVQKFDQDRTGMDREISVDNDADGTKQRVGHDVTESHSRDSCVVHRADADNLRNVGFQDIGNNSLDRLVKGAKHGVNSTEKSKASYDGVESVHGENVLSHEKWNSNEGGEIDEESCDNANMRKSVVIDDSGNNDDVNDKECSSLYNLQMLGEVALNTELPVKGNVITGK